MPFNSFLGRKDVVQLLLSLPSAFFVSSRQSPLIRLFGPLLIKVLGFPLNVQTRLRTRDLMNLLPPTAGHLLDMGCGWGIHDFELSKSFFVTGIDQHRGKIRIARELKHILGIKQIDFLYGDVFEANLKDEKFSVVVMSEVLQHIKDCGGIIERVKRMLKTGGHLIISVPCYAEYSQILQQSPLEGYTTYHRFSPKSIIDLLQNKGFKIKKVKFTHVPQVPTTWLIFPFAYAISLLAAPYINNKVKLHVLAIKEK